MRMYTPRQHVVFSARLANFHRELRQLQIEGVALGEIYAAQTANGEVAEFVDSDVATVDELRAGMGVAGSYLSWLTGASVEPQEDRRPVTVPFLQTE